MDLSRAKRVKFTDCSGAKRGNLRSKQTKTFCVCLSVSQRYDARQLSRPYIKWFLLLGVVRDQKQIGFVGTGDRSSLIEEKIFQEIPSSDPFPTFGCLGD